MMLLIRRCGLFLFLLLLLTTSGCQLSSTDPVDEQEKPVTENPQKKHMTKTAELEPEEKRIDLGIEGYQEEVKVQKYINSWVSLWADSQLELNEEDNQVEFKDEQSGLSFIIQRLSTTLAKEKYDQILSELLSSDYELINEFPLENRNGQGAILYSYNHRYSVDLYLVEEKQQKFLVKFVIPEELMERYIHRFEYMFNSIEIIS